MQNIFEYLEVVNNRERQPSTLVGGEVYVTSVGQLSSSLGFEL